jgi:deferrochelatase/peroxidase EfeB
VCSGGVTRPEHTRQVALTPRGLRALGVPADVVDQFAQEAKLGMASRTRTLGDEDANDPAHWAFGRVGDRVDALLVVMARNAEARADEVARERDRLRDRGGFVIAEELSAEWAPREPFGFADGLSQPVIRGAEPRNGQPRAPDDVINPGEILLGHKNEYGYDPRSPSWNGFDLGRNGTYLVFRKLRQDVTTFWRYFAARASELRGQAPIPGDHALATHWLAARAMGRWRNGSSTVAFPDAPGPADSVTINDFEYLKKDPEGLRCPIASHVRRANPRDARGGPEDAARKVVRRHRILRRGRAYGSFVEPEVILGGARPPAPAACSSFRSRRASRAGSSSCSRPGSPTPASTASSTSPTRSPAPAARPSRSRRARCASACRRCRGL